MRGNVVESGLLEIYRFLPPALLEDFDIEERIVAQAIADVFASD